MNKIKGGKADGMTIEDIASKHGISVEEIAAQIEKGVKVELEHTNDEAIAREIATDHVFEMKDYYDRLSKMEMQNAKQAPKVYYCMHIEAGVAQYDDEMLLIQNDALKSMNKSMAGVPVYVNHQKVDLSALPEKADGFVSESFYNEVDGCFWARFIAVSDKAHEAISRRWKVSNAYIPTQTAGGGVYHNIKFNREVLNAYYTHLAIVPNPRYENSVILTEDDFKAYNDKKRSELKELQNAKETTKGGIKMFKLFRREEVKDTIDLEKTSLQLQNGKETTVAELIAENERLSAQIVNAESDEKEIEVGEEKMTLNELKKRYLTRKNADDDAEKAKKEADEKKNQADAEEAKKKKEEEEAKEKAEKEKQNAIEAKNKELLNAAIAAKSTESVLVMSDKIAKGKEKY